MNTFHFPERVLNLRDKEIKKSPRFEGTGFKFEIHTQKHLVNLFKFIQREIFNLPECFLGNKGMNCQLLAD